MAANELPGDESQINKNIAEGDGKAEYFKPYIVKDPNNPNFVATTTNTRSGTKARKEQVGKWQGARPVTGKGGAKSDAEKEAKRQKMIQWAQWNPNKRSNAQRAVKKSK